MSNLKKAVLLETYRWATLPFRAFKNLQCYQRGQHPVILLYYHRVADTDPVAWSLTNAQFKAHVDWLERRYDLVSMSEAQRRVREGADRPTVHITFDDGYAENCDRALPLLIEKCIPCTYFVTLENVAMGKPFVHDQDAGGQFPVNTIDQLRELSDLGIEIGAHTRTHPNMGEVHDVATVYDEIVTARRELADLIEKPIRYFAFPFGMKPNLSHGAAAMARREGIECVVSAYGGYNYFGDDAFHLQRVHGDPELSRLKNAISFDPRHVRREKFELLTTGPEVANALDFYNEQNPKTVDVASINLFSHVQTTNDSDGQVC